MKTTWRALDCAESYTGVSGPYRTELRGLWIKQKSTDRSLSRKKKAHRGPWFKQEGSLMPQNPKKRQSSEAPWVEQKFQPSALPVSFSVAQGVLNVFLFEPEASDCLSVWPRILIQHFLGQGCWIESTEDWTACEDMPGMQQINYNSLKLPQELALLVCFTCQSCSPLFLKLARFCL